ncbi:winged helix-turn-helix transcriptional regulator [Sphingobacterium arenae]|uniref:Helix-turn-helix transcriptional regulator n=1 Tax=Sphingobacterium arenae TaxID=1280598 RepID=A0ABR7Y5U2_9SPHI|nr:helix-turn-helix domain-containing protein [Sphingobacterium arenae]MBD1426666.1 helix-turn-helix transcriptional regulator [Sphingobacterium arenae]
MRKETSTNTFNKEKIESTCGMAYTVSVLSGRWKLSILGFLLDGGTLRYNELKRKAAGISERMLIAQLKDLEADGLIERKAYPEIPPRVEYKLSKKGKSLETILNLMSTWGEDNKSTLP